MPTDRGRGKKPSDDVVTYRAWRLRRFLSGHARVAVPLAEVEDVLGLPYERLKKSIDVLSRAGDVVRYASAKDGSLWLSIRERASASGRRCGTCAEASTVYPQTPRGPTGESLDVCQRPGGPDHVVPDGPPWDCRWWKAR